MTRLPADSAHKEEAAPNLQNFLRGDAANLLSVGKPSTLLAKCWEIFLPTRSASPGDAGGPVFDFIWRTQFWWECSGAMRAKARLSTCLPRGRTSLFAARAAIMPVTQSFTAA